MPELVMGIASELAPVGGEEQASRPIQLVESSMMMMLLLMMRHRHVKTKE